MKQIKSRLWEEFLTNRDGIKRAGAVIGISAVVLFCIGVMGRIVYDIITLAR